MLVRQILAVFTKEMRSELKTRFALNAALMFVLTTVLMIAFSTKEERLSASVAAGLLWVILFFSAMTGLAKSFVSEEERGTALLLRLSTQSTAVYFGKLLYNIVLTLVLYAIGVLFFFLFMAGTSIQTHSIFWAVFVLGSVATAGATTLISAIIARAHSKNALFSVLSFPLVLPLVLTGVETTTMALAGATFESAQSNLQLIGSYVVVLVAVSTMLFDFVWKD